MLKVMGIRGYTHGVKFVRSPPVKNKSSARKKFFPENCLMYSVKVSCNSYAKRKDGLRRKQISKTLERLDILSPFKYKDFMFKVHAFKVGIASFPIMSEK